MAAVNSNVANTDRLVVQIESAIISSLRNQGKYSKVFSSATSNATDAELKITVTITNIRDINTFDRLMWEALAGLHGIETIRNPYTVLFKGLVQA